MDEDLDLASGSTSGVPLTSPEVAQPAHAQPISMAPTGSQMSRHGHTSHHKPSSSSGSLSTGLSAHPRKLSVDVRPPTPASATLFDEDLLDVIETATDIADSVWLKLAEDIGASASPTNGQLTVGGHSKSNSQSSFMSNMSSATRQTFGTERPNTIPTRLHADMVNLLSRAEQITTALRESPRWYTGQSRHMESLVFTR